MRQIKLLTQILLICLLSSCMSEKANNGPLRDDTLKWGGKHFQGIDLSHRN